MNQFQLKSFSAAQTHPGHKRQVNEDAIYSSCEQGIWAVADGMGGYAAGDIASRTVIDALRKVESGKEYESLHATIDGLKDAVLIANQQLLFELTLPKGCQQAGSTVAILAYFPQDNMCACLWVGDSRIYVLRDQELYQVTKDHSVVQEMVDKGVLAPEHRDTHPQSHVITRAVGVSDQLDIDVVTFEPKSGDVYFICSDGLYNEVDVNGMLRCVSSQRELKQSQQKYCDRVAEDLLSEVLKTDARDNVSINVVTLS